MNTKLPVSRIQCEPDRTYNKADDMHLRASIKSRLDKGLKPLLQPVALKKLENNPDYDYAVDDGRRRFQKSFCAARHKKIPPADLKGLTERIIDTFSKS